MRVSGEASINQTNVARLWTPPVKPAATINFTAGLCHGGGNMDTLGGHCRYAVEATDEQMNGQTDKQTDEHRPVATGE